jgi:hypothetical protein
MHIVNNQLLTKAVSMNKDLISIPDYIRQHCVDSMNNALGAVRYTTWERNCPELSDTDFTYLGLLRCVTPVDSGRHFIQNTQQLHDFPCPHSTYFGALHSIRRKNMLNAVSTESYKLLCAEASKYEIDYLDHFPELDGYDVEAADGHFITHACHTPQNAKGKVFAAGFIYAMNLRNGFLNPICKVTNGTKKSHEIPCFRKWIEKECNNKNTNKKLYIYDRAAIDYKWWDKQKKNDIYMISVLKENAVTTFVRALNFNPNDKDNIGIISYELHRKGKAQFTVTTYKDPETGTVLKFISTLPSSFRPGIIAILYYKRWTIEKAFNNSKSDLKERKAWSSENSALNTQMRLTAMTYNIIRLFEEISKKHKCDLIHPAVKKYNKTLDWRQRRAEVKSKFVNPIHFLKRVARISSFTIRTVQSAIFNKYSLEWLMDELIRRLIPRQAWN